MSCLHAPSATSASKRATRAMVRLKADPTDARCRMPVAAESTSNDRPASVNKLRWGPALAGPRMATSGRNFGYPQRMKALQKRPGRVAIELRIRGLDAEKKSVARRAVERRDVEDRVIRRRQPVDREHPDKRRERRAEHRA